MKRSKFTDEQILATVRDGQAGRKVIDLLHPRHHRADRRRLEGHLIRGSWRRLCSSKAQATMDRGEIRPDMPVVCGMDATAQFATVDHVEGDEIKLKRDASGQHHYIPVSSAAGIVDGKVQVDPAAKDVMASWRTEAR